MSNAFTASFTPFEDADEMEVELERVARRVFDAITSDEELTNARTDVLCMGLASMITNLLEAHVAIMGPHLAVDICRRTCADLIMPHESDTMH